MDQMNYATITALRLAGVVASALLTPPLMSKGPFLVLVPVCTISLLCIAIIRDAILMQLKVNKNEENDHKC